MPLPIGNLVNRGNNQIILGGGGSTLFLMQCSVIRKYPKSEKGKNSVQPKIRFWYSVTIWKTNKNNSFPILLIFRHSGEVISLSLQQRKKLCYFCVLQNRKACRHAIQCYFFFYYSGKYISILRSLPGFFPAIYMLQHWDTVTTLGPNCMRNKVIANIDKLESPPNKSLQVNICCLVDTVETIDKTLTKD